MDAAEHELLDRATGGDRDALAELLMRHAPPLRRKLSGQIPARWQSVLSVDDVLQQTYTDAMLDIARFVPRPDATLDAWLGTLARRNLQDAIRMLEAEKRGGKRRAISISDLDASYDGLYEMLSSSSSTPSRRATRDEARDALRQAIQSLPDDHQSVVRLVDLEGHTVAETAARLGRSPGAVYMLRARAHRWLFDILAGDGAFSRGSRE